MAGATGVMLAEHSARGLEHRCRVGRAGCVVLGRPHKLYVSSTQQQFPAHSPVPLENHTTKTSSSGAALSVVGTEAELLKCTDQTSHG